MTVRVDISGGIATVFLDNPPVNAIDLQVREGLIDAIDEIEARSDVTRVILTGAGNTFSAGGDLREFDMEPVAPHLADVVDRIEQSLVPWVAAINGAAKGGGVELCLACKARIAAPGIRIGFPEVNLGVVPGAGGTQRLPRLIGLAPALDMICTGRLIAAEAALDLGLIDHISKDPLRQAATTSILEREPLSQETAPSFDAVSLGAARKNAAEKRPGELAPQRAIDLVSKACTTAFSEAILQEREAFLDLRSGEQSRALRHMFLAERAAAKLRGPLEANPRELQYITVVGGGTMGSGIVWACLNAGYKVTLIERDDDLATRSGDSVKSIAKATVERGLISEPDARQRTARLTTTCRYEDASKADLVIEAAYEAMDVKKDILLRLEETVLPQVPIATNTSYLNVDEMAAVLSDPSRMLGLHFFVPAHVMKLIEVVEGAQTSDQALATGLLLARSLRKIPVISGVGEGFIGNRILSRSRLIADHLLLHGALPGDVDRAMESFGYAMGPYRVQDLSGLDIGYANRRRQDSLRDEDAPYVAIADDLVESGRLGRKSGKGWYDYSQGSAREDKAIADLIQRHADRRRIKRVSVTDVEIRDQLLIAMINEAADILLDGIAENARDIDLVSHLGYGFPRWRGGLLYYADTLGPRALLRDLRKLQEDNPDLWTPSPLIEAMAAMGTTFSDYRRL